VSSTYVSADLVWDLVLLGFIKVNPDDRFDMAPNNTHVMANYKHGDAPEPCNVPNTQN